MHKSSPCPLKLFLETMKNVKNKKQQLMNIQKMNDPKGITTTNINTSNTNTSNTNTSNINTSKTSNINTSDINTSNITNALPLIDDMILTLAPQTFGDQDSLQGLCTPVISVHLGIDTFLHATKMELPYFVFHNGILYLYGFLYLRSCIGNPGYPESLELGNQFPLPIIYSSYEHSIFLSRQRDYPWIRTQFDTETCPIPLQHDSISVKGYPQSWPLQRGTIYLKKVFDSFVDGKESSLSLLSKLIHCRNKQEGGFENCIHITKFCCKILDDPMTIHDRLEGKNDKLSFKFFGDYYIMVNHVEIYPFVVNLQFHTSIDFTIAATLVTYNGTSMVLRPTGDNDLYRCTLSYLFKQNSIQDLIEEPNLIRKYFLQIPIQIQSNLPYAFANIKGTYCTVSFICGVDEINDQCADLVPHSNYKPMIECKVKGALYLPHPILNEFITIYSKHDTKQLTSITMQLCIPLWLNNNDSQCYTINMQFMHTSTGIMNTRKKMKQLPPLLHIITQYLPLEIDMGNLERQFLSPQMIDKCQMIDLNMIRNIPTCNISASFNCESLSLQMDGFINISRTNPEIPHIHWTLILGLSNLQASCLLHWGSHSMSIPIHYRNYKIQKRLEKFLFQDVYPDCRVITQRTILNVQFPEDT